ncbi:MAG: hypothetical protein WCH83_17860, partial [Alphaproteobacteria bacterium]
GLMAGTVKDGLMAGNVKYGFLAGAVKDGMLAGTVEDGWVAGLVSAAEDFGADVVGGPVHPCFSADVDANRTSHPVFWPAYDRTGPVPMIYGSGNCLIRRSLFARLGQPPFDPRFNFLGGGDTDFFCRAKRAGASFYWVQEAMITETVPDNRTELRWILTRGRRIGAINRALDLKVATGLRGRVKVMAKDAIIAALSPIRSAKLLVSTRNPIAALHPIMVAIGRLASATGHEPEQYRAKAPR